MPKFSQDAFDSFWPDEEGLIEARKRLIENARYFYLFDDRPSEAWVKIVRESDDLSYYLSLIGEENLPHIIEWVWKGIGRSLD